MSFRRNPHFLDQIEDTATRRLAIAAEGVRQEVVSLIEEPKSGVQHASLPNPSSEPGDPPASQSGELAESIRVDGPIISQDMIEAHINTPLFKGRVLEGGLASLAARPFLRPGLMGSRHRVMKAMAGQGVSDG